MNIRKATMADYDRLVALDTAAHHQHVRQQQIRSWIRAEHCYRVGRAEVVVGYGVLTYHFFGNGFIDMIMIGNAFRRQGAGKALIQHFRQLCQTPKLFSSTNLSNQPMQKLLISSGFRESGIIENLDENDPEIVYISVAR